MVYVRLFFLALLASLCEVSHGACSRRGRAGSAVPRVVPTATCLPASPCSTRRYERTLENIISKLINALVYTTIRNTGGSGGSGSEACESGSGDPLLGVDVGFLGQDLANVELLPGLIDGDSGTGSSTSGVTTGGVSTDSGTSCSCIDSGSNDSGGDSTGCGGSGAISSDIVKLLEELLNMKVEVAESDSDILKIVLLGQNE